MSKISGSLETRLLVEAKAGNKAALRRLKKIFNRRGFTVKSNSLVQLA
jgi:hypothetical protein